MYIARNLCVAHLDRYLIGDGSIAILSKRGHENAQLLRGLVQRMERPQYAAKAPPRAQFGASRADLDLGGVWELLLAEGCPSNRICNCASCNSDYTRGSVELACLDNQVSTCCPLTIGGNSHRTEYVSFCMFYSPFVIWYDFFVEDLHLDRPLSMRSGISGTSKIKSVSQTSAPVKNFLRSQLRQN